MPAANSGFRRRNRCPHCLAADFAFKPVSGRGKVYSFVTFHRVYHPAFAGEVPYVVAMVELEEGPRLLSNIVGIKPDAVACEMPVKVVFDDVADERQRAEVHAGLNAQKLHLILRSPRSGRLEGWAGRASMVRDALLRNAPHHEEKVVAAVFSITTFDQRLVLDPAAQIVDEDLGESVAVAGSARAADMRRDQHIRQRPERMIRWQRFLHRHVQTGARNLARLQCFDQCRLVDHLAARDVDDIGGRLHRADHRAAQNLLRLGVGNRGEADDVGFRGGGLQLAAWTDAVDIRNGVGRAGNPGHRHVEGFGLARDLLADGAETDQHQMLAGKVIGRGRDFIAPPDLVLPGPLHRAAVGARGRTSRRWHARPRRRQRKPDALVTITPEGSPWAAAPCRSRMC